MAKREKKLECKNCGGTTFFRGVHVSYIEYFDEDGNVTAKSDPLDGNDQDFEAIYCSDCEELATILDDIE